MINAIQRLIHPKKLYSSHNILIRNGPVPESPGIYAWYFKEIPPNVPIDDCIESQGKYLLYVGISPSRPPKEGKLSKQNLRKRIIRHYRGNAYGSTLRLSLGCLLSEQLGIKLQRVGKSKKRLTFAKGEAKLSEWMKENAFVTWVIHEKPWMIEGKVIQEISLPFNLRGNENHPFYENLTGLRSKMRSRSLIERN